MKIQDTQFKQIGRTLILEKINQSMCKKFTEFKEYSFSDRFEFLNECYNIATLRNFTTEQGIASYVLAAWFLGLEFENASMVLLKLLKSDVSEVCRVHAMNEWVSATIAEPTKPELANDALKQAFAKTQAWN